MNLVYSSLNEYDNDRTVMDGFLLEGLSLNDIKKSFNSLTNPSLVIDRLISQLNATRQNKLRVKLASTILMLIIYMGANRGIPSHIKTHDVKMNATEVALKADIKRDDLVELSKNMLVTDIGIDEEIVRKLNVASSGSRFNTDSINTYNMFDKNILDATQELRMRGEKPNPMLIKSIMLIETGMRPRKNKQDYTGFPQTKKRIVDSINKRFGQSFTMKDMYNAKESAKFIHYMLKALYKSKYVNHERDAVAAYNWGLGNWTNHMLGRNELPRQTRDYMDMVSVFIN